MCKNRVKIILALIITVAIVISSTVSVFAEYKPLFTVESHEWLVTSDSTFKSQYPDVPLSGDINNSDFPYNEEIWGEYCYLGFTTEENNFIHSIPVSFDSSNFKYDDFYIFTNNVYIYLINFDSSDVMLFLDDKGSLSFFVPSTDYSSIEIDFYNLSYPFESINKLRTATVGWKDCDYEYDKFFKYFTASNLAPVYSTCDVYDYQTQSVMYQADEKISGEFFSYIDLEKSLVTYDCYMAFILTEEQMIKMCNGDYVFRFNNTGFIPFYDCVYSYLTCGLVFMDANKNYLGTDMLFENEYGSPMISKNVDSPYEMSSLDMYFEDYVVSWMNTYIESSDVKYECYMYWNFACDEPSLFFPGTLEILDYGSYKDDFEHTEILNAINDSSTTISNAVADAVTDISGTIEKHMNVLIKDDTGVDKVVIDTSGLDDLVVQQDDIIDAVYGDLDADIKNNLPDGYNDPYDYITDSISNFSSINSTFEFIKKMYDNTVAVTGMGSVILFCLSFGFATYAIGRRLS